MTEADILYQLTLTREDTLDMIQWWAGITFGLVAVSHFASKKLNLFFVILLLLLYISFSIVSLQNLFFYAQELASLSEDLSQLSAAGEISNYGQQFLRRGEETNSLPNIAGPIAFLGTFVGSIGYVVYSYRKARRGK